MGQQTKKSVRTVDQENDLMVSETALIDAGEEWQPSVSQSVADDGAIDATAERVAVANTSTADSVPDITETAVRNVLSGLTGTADMFAGERVGANLKMTKDEVNAIAPPLTRIINRNAKLKAVAAQGDLAQVVFNLTFGYGVRVVGEAAETNRKKVEELAAAENAAKTTQTAEAFNYAVE